jgi:orotate phosphoribosyltransferase-like protein
MKRLSEEKIQQIIQLYNNGVTPKEIGLQFGIMNNSVTRILKKQGIERNQLKKISPEQIDYIIEQYYGGINSEKIAEELNIDASTVCRILHRTGNQIRPSEENKRIYNINQNYFSNVDSEHKAYILGFLYADDSLTEKNSITITLNAKDIDILQKISHLIYGFEKIDIFSRALESGEIANYATLHIYSKKMVSDLAALGCTVNKTFTITLPQLRQDLMKHFIRGYFDGDGCISLTTDKNRIDFTSNIIFLTGLKEYLLNTINIDFGKININSRNDKIGNLQLSSSLKMKTFLDYIYLNSNIYLDRKYELYLKYSGIIKNKRQKKIDKSQDMTRYGST